MANKQARISDYWGKESEEEEDGDVIEVTPTAEGSKVGEKKRKHQYGTICNCYRNILPQATI